MILLKRELTVSLRRQHAVAATCRISLSRAAHVAVPWLATACEDGFTLIDGACYRAVLGDDMSYAAAAAACAPDALASVHSAEAHAALVTMCKDSTWWLGSCWVGLADPDADDEFEWAGVFARRDVGACPHPPSRWLDALPQRRGCSLALCWGHAHAGQR